jgi:hypothetical protein
MILKLKLTGMGDIRPCNCITFLDIKWVIVEIDKLQEGRKF